DQKGSPQTLGILGDKKDFWDFVYDVFIGIRFHHKKPSE
ncbi:MAG: beta-carotene hydroxylase, partial [Microcoleaceae cyanobacterium]